MPTEVISRIKASGGEYTNLSAWEAARNANLVAGDRVEIAEVYGDINAGGCTFAGWTMDDTRYAIVRPAAGERHAGVWDDAKARATVSTGSCFVIDGLNSMKVVIDGMQLGLTGTQTYSSAVSSTTSAVGSLHVIGCIQKGPGTFDGNCGVRVGVAGNFYFVANIIYDFYSAANQFTCGIRNTSASSAVYAYNNTLYNCGRGVKDDYSNIRAKNNLARACVDGYQGTFHADSTHNASDIASDGPATGRVTFSTGFESAAARDLHITTTDAASLVGTDLSADAYYPFNTDIDAQTVTAWSIGADAQAGASGGGGITGSAAITLDDATVSAAGSTVDPVTGTGAITLDDATVSASGSITEPVTGSASVTLGDVTASGVGSVTDPITGSASITLGDAVVTATGGGADMAGGGIQLYVDLRPLSYSVDLRPVSYTVDLRPVSLRVDLRAA